MAGIDSRTAAERERPTDATWSNVAGLGERIERGIEAGDIRPCHASFNASLTLEWLEQRTGRDEPVPNEDLDMVDVDRAVADVVSNGGRTRTRRCRNS